jgi:hypothetical protein
MSNQLLTIARKFAADHHISNVDVLELINLIAVEILSDCQLPDSHHIRFTD